MFPCLKCNLIGGFIGNFWGLIDPRRRYEGACNFAQLNERGFLEVVKDSLDLVLRKYSPGYKY